MCEIFSKLTIKTPKRRLDIVLVSLLLTDFTHRSGVSIVDFEQVNAGWEKRIYNPVKHLR